MLGVGNSSRYGSLYLDYLRSCNDLLTIFEVFFFNACDPRTSRHGRVGAPMSLVCGGGLGSFSGHRQLFRIRYVSSLIIETALYVSYFLASW
jgi:hypothetical protein